MSLVLDRSLHYEQCVPYAAILQIFNCLAWFETVEFNHLPRSNHKMCDDAVFVSRFHYQLTMFGTHRLIGLSRLLHAPIAYDTDGTKMIAAFCRISYSLHDLIQFKSIVSHVQRARCTMVWFSIIVPIWIDLCEVCILIGLFWILDTDIAYVITI